MEVSFPDLGNTLLSSGSGSRLQAAASKAHQNQTKMSGHRHAIYK